MSHKTLEIKLEKLAYGGDAIGRLPDGRAVGAGVPASAVGGTAAVDGAAAGPCEHLELLSLALSPH